MTETHTLPPPEDEAPADWGPLSALPGTPFMWILIISELAVFGAFLMGFAGARLAAPDMFADSQAHLSRLYGGLNTLVLVTSGWFAALAVRNRADDNLPRARLWLGAAAALGLVFLIVKVFEYSEKISAGLGLEENTFWTLYWLITGFHALHVLAGIGILALVSWKPSLENIETGTAFWHMVDLIWVLVYPVIYLIR